MDREQIKVLQASGFALEAVPGLYRQPRAKYYSIDKGSNKVVEHNLPADPYSLGHYLKKGFVLNPNDLKPQAEDEFVCTTCGDKFTKRIALVGHSRKHKKIL